MKTYNKLLAVACITCCTNVHADTINWEEVSHFFNFDTIEVEKRTHLETNIRLLVEEQLKLPSGQNLWKAFQFWKNQHPELGFQFCFSLMDNLGAHIELKNYENQTFLFAIAINKVFAEDFKIPFWQVIKKNLHQKTNLGFKKLLNENILYRPCLIKLVDSNNPEKWEYHLREQKLPFFITLAHEFLHALNQLERIDKYLNSDLLDKYHKNQDILFALGDKLSMQNFLAQKLHLMSDVGILNDKYLSLWGNKGNDDFLDEMTVILESKRLISINEFVFIGETTFLQEYYQDNTIISWSHCSARELDFWQKMITILNKNYVSEILQNNQFFLDKTVLKCFKILKDSKIKKEMVFSYIDSSDFKICKQKAEEVINKNRLLDILQKSEGTK